MSMSFPSNSGADAGVYSFFSGCGVMSLTVAGMIAGSGSGLSAL